MKLLIRNLPRTVTEISLKKLFMPFGIVKECTLVVDETTKKSKGFGFVEMDASRDADKAIKAMDNKFLQGNKIRVKIAK